jgi:hypothetical protein
VRQGEGCFVLVLVVVLVLEGHLVTFSTPHDRRNSRARTTPTTRTTGESPYRTTVPHWNEMVSQVSVLAG